MTLLMFAAIFVVIIAAVILVGGFVLYLLTPGSERREYWK